MLLRDWSKTANFSPQFGAGTSISVTTSSSSVSSLDTTCTEVLLTNDSTTGCYVRWGVGAQTATTGDLYLPPNTTQCFFKGPADTVAAITASGSTTVRLIVGKGQ